MKIKSAYSLIVWNVYKNKRPLLAQRLSEMFESHDFVLVQEYVSSLNHIIPKNYFLEANYTFELPVQKCSTGTATISKHKPTSTIKQFSRHKEIGITTHKSIISTVHDLGGNNITLVNMHALNFVHTKLYAEAYREWLKILPSSGPVIFAGDFNTWNSRRFKFIEREMSQRGFQYCHYDTDKILKLDHIWTRGVDVKKMFCHTDSSDSDHYPLEILFSM